MLLFVFFPSFLVRNKDSLTHGDTFFFSFIHAHVVIIPLIHILAFLKILEMFSLSFSLILLYILIARFNRKSPLVFSRTSVILKMFDLSDQPGGIRLVIRQLIRNASQKVYGFIQQALHSLKTNPFAWAGIFSLFIYSVFIRFHHAFTKLYFGASDSYVHLEWAKRLGVNELYVNGVYPYGYQTIITTLQKIFGLDPYYIIRFIGPIASTLLILSIVYVVIKLTKSVTAGFLAMCIYVVLGFSYDLIWRQMHALPMEYAAIFILPGILYFSHYIKENSRRSIILAAECLFLTVLIHPYSALVLGVAYLGIFIVRLRSVFASKQFVPISLWIVGAGLFGLLPVGLGLLSGKSFHPTSINYVIDSVRENNQGFEALWNQLTSIPLLLFLVVTIVLLGIILLSKNGRKAYTLEWFVVTVLFIIMYQPSLFYLPVLMDDYRMLVFTTLIGTVSITLALFVIGKYLTSRIGRTIWYSVVILLFTLAHTSTGLSAAIPKGNIYQYEEAVQTYLEIKQNYPIKEWTIISPIEEYSMALGYGWHYNLWEFVDNADKLEEIENDGTPVTFETPNIFIFIEKNPIGSSGAKQLVDISKPLPKLSDPTDYYKIPEVRFLIQAKAMYMLDTLIAKHSEITIYKETENLIVYQVKKGDYDGIQFTKNSIIGVKNP